MKNTGPLEVSFMINAMIGVNQDMIPNMNIAEIVTSMIRLTVK